MQPRITMLSTAALSAAISLGSAALGADLPKEGTFTATYFGAGTVKTTPLGKERWFNTFDENGLSVGSGLLDHMTWHVWGLSDGTNAVAQFRGNGVSTDPAGDHIAVEFVSDGKVDLSKLFDITVTITAGTGKYAGISGGWTFTAHSSEFKAPEGRYFQYAITKGEGSYKLP